MDDKERLSILIDRLQWRHCTPGAELNGDIWLALGHPNEAEVKQANDWGNQLAARGDLLLFARKLAPHYSLRLDAARSIIPPGYDHEIAALPDGRMRVSVWIADNPMIVAEATSAPLALCAAILKHRYLERYGVQHSQAV